MSLNHHELVAALRAVPGVRDADLAGGPGVDGTSSPGGPGVLRLDLEPGVVGGDVAGLVDKILRAQFGLGVDPAHVAEPSSVRELTALTPRTAPTEAPGPSAVTPSAAPSPERLRAGGRPSFVRLHVASASLESTASVTLALGEREVTGLAVGLASPTAVLRTVVIATLRAVEQLIGTAFRVELEPLDVSCIGPERTVVVLVSAHAPYGAEVLTGACAIQEDAPQAAARATLNALNRRLELLLAEA